MTADKECMRHEAVKRTHSLEDGVRVESVWLPIRGRTTLCLSSQAGCGQGCVFCATGAMGFVRNLTAAEIVGQAEDARRAGRTPDNLVFMGMGEPLENPSAVAEAIRIFSSPRNWHIPPRRITVSTAGHADGIRAMGEWGFPNLRLAVSLNAASDDLRNRLMPINRRYPLAVLREAMRAFLRRKRDVALVEYVLLAGVNDSDAEAGRVADFLDGIPARVNVIPWNAVPGLPFRAPTPEAVRRFGDRLMKAGLFVRTRVARGETDAAACGQLAADKTCDF